MTDTSVPAEEPAASAQAPAAPAGPSSTITLPSGAVLTAADVEALKSALGLEEKTEDEPVQAPDAPPPTPPVNAHPAYGIVSELLSHLNLQPLETAYRSVYSWLESHASELEAIAGDIAKALP